MSNRIGDRFEIIRCLGEGSLGTSYLCRQLDLDLYVVVRVVAPEIALSESDAKQLRDALVRGYAISHRNVARGYEYFRHDDYLAYTREYVPGESLSQLLERGPLEIRRCFSILHDVIEGLEGIHAGASVHQSLKPQNVICMGDGPVKLSDHGMAAVGRPYREKRQLSYRLGAVDYEVPEIVANEFADYRADIYGVGQLAYVLFTGQLPFTGGSVEEVRRRRIDGSFLAPKALNPDLLESLNDVIVRALKRNPAKRFQSLADLRAALDVSLAEYFPPVSKPFVV